MTAVRIRQWLMERAVQGKRNGEDWTNFPQLEEIFVEFAAVLLSERTTPVRVFITELNGSRYEVNPLVLTDTLHVNYCQEATSPKENVIQFRVNSRIYSIEFEGLSREAGALVRQKTLPESIASLEAKLAFPPPPTKHGDCSCRECLDTNGGPIVKDEVKGGGK